MRINRISFWASLLILLNIIQKLSMRRGDLPFKYLGVPLFKGAPRRRHLRTIADRIIAKFSKWKGETLSMAGRLTLINSVIASSLKHLHDL